MKKTLIAAAIIILIVPAMLSAKLMSFSAGVTGQYKIPVDAQTLEWDESMGDIENYQFGADIRTRILFAEVDAMALLGNTQDELTLDGVVTGGLSLDLLGLVRVGLGLGPRVIATFPSGGTPTFIFKDGTEIGEDFQEAIMQTPLTWRATADIKLGKILVGLNYTVDSNDFSLDSNNYTDLLPGTDQWESGRIGASVLFTLF